MEDAKKKFIEIRDALVMGDKPLKDVIPNYTPEKVSLALIAYRKTHSWAAYLNFMEECANNGEKLLAVAHTTKLCITGGMKEARDFFETNFVNYGSV